MDVSKFRDVKLQINSSRTYMASPDKFKDADVFHSAILPISLDIFVFPFSYYNNFLFRFSTHSGRIKMFPERHSTRG